MRKAVIIIAMSLLLTGCLEKNTAVRGNTAGEVQVPPTVAVQPAVDEYVAIGKLGNFFGFTNETGKLIILPGRVEEVQGLDDISKAIGENGNVLTVRYLGPQKGNEKDNGRLTSRNFDNLEGHIFEVTEGAAIGDETYYLVSEDGFNIRSVLDSQEGSGSEIDLAAKEEIEGIKNRKIQDSWEIGKLEKDKSIYLVLFEREQDDMLASIVMKTPSKMVFKDYPAKYDASSTWRVDDGGSIYPEMFSILFASKTETGILLGITWIGAEGEVTTLLKENGDAFEELDIGTSRYTSPL